MDCHPLIAQEIKSKTFLKTTQLLIERLLGLEMFTSAQLIDGLIKKLGRALWLSIFTLSPEL